MQRGLAVVAGVMLSCGALAADGTALQKAGNDLGDGASLQRGARMYMQYCGACHSLKYLRYSRLVQDLGFSEDEVMNDLNLSGAKIGEHIISPMPVEGAIAAYGKAPPDLTLMARVRGSDWLYTYLKSFYQDAERPLGWNNTFEFQGTQQAEYGAPDATTGERPVLGLKLAEPGTQKPAEFDQSVRDIVNFLEYAGEPAVLQRRSLGPWVVLFLGVFTVLTYLLKREYWKDVH
jgi:ubiquinol-cytochrome c reductase cytochrome c1 subunit